MKRFSFILALVVATIFAPQLFAATVFTLADSGPGSLREAVAAGGTVDFAVIGTITLTSGELVVNGPLTINGPGAAQLAVERSTEAGTPEFRVLRVQSGSVTISGLAIRNGLVGATYGNGGGILNEGSLTLNDCVVSGNRSTGEYTRGTGVFNAPNARLIANRCVLADNAGAGEYSEGGGLYVFGDVSLNDSTVSGNSGGGFYSRGGGMHVDYFGTGHVARCTFSGNSVAGGNAQGGGIYNYGTLQIVNSTLSGNRSGGSGGGMHVDALSLGTAIRNCTISANTAPEGAGIFNNGSEPGNVATITVRDSIVAGNLSQDIENNGAITSAGYNLFGLVSGNAISPSAGDQFGLTAAALKLGPLADNGGPTRTRALLTGSPAIDAGSETGFLATDQRGVPRPIGPRADIGAFEGAQPPPTNLPPTVSIVTPASGAVFNAPARVVLIAQANDPDGYFTIQTVEFFANNVSLGIRTNFATMNPIGPFFLVWTNVPAGEYTLTARAMDELGATATSEPVRIRVFEPAIAIGYPREGDSFTTPTNLPIIARVFVAVATVDFLGSITNVGFFANDVKLGEVHSSVPDPEPMPPFISFAFTWTNPPPGSYALTAKATTDSGAMQTSLPVHITVGPAQPVVNVEAFKADAYELGDFKSRALIFRVTRTDPIDFDLPVSYRVGGTAQNGVDYEELSGQVIIPNGAREATILTSARFDEISEGDETVEIAIERPACNDTSPPPRECYEVGEHGAASGLIHDAPVTPPVVSLELVDREAAETLINQNNIDWAEFRVRRTGDLTHELFLFLNTQQGSARLGEDYWLDGVNNGSSVRIPAGTNSVNVRLYPIDDDFYEGDETVFFHLIAPPPGSVRYEIDFAHSSVDMVIHDNDPVATRLDITSPHNGQEFQPGDTITLRAQIIGPGSSNSWSVDFFDGDQRLGTTRPNAPIWWGDASGGRHVITARAINSQGTVLTSTPPVTIQVGPGAALPVVKIGATPWHTGEPCPTCFVAPSILTIERTAPTNSALTVFLEIDGTATAGVDYQVLPTSVEIPAGQRSAQLTLLARDDQLAEGPEVVRVRVLRQPPPLLPPTYFVNVYAQEALVVIFDDEPGAPPARLDIIAPTNGSHLRFPSTIPLSALAVNTQNEVYGPVEFYAGDQLVARSQVTATTRPAIPGLPSVHTAYWTNPPVGQYVLTARTRLSFSQSITSPPVNVTVDSPMLPVVSLETFPPQNAQAREFCPPNMDCAYPSFVVRRSGPTNADLSVYLSYAGTATAGADYPALPGRVVIPAGRDAALLTLVPNDDTLVEGPETVIATFTAVPAPYIQDPNHASATITIIDNDRPGSNQPPRIAITRPVNGAEFPPDTAIEIVAETRDPDGYVPKVEFFADRRKIGESSIVFIRPPDPGQTQTFTFVWRHPEPGRHSLTARATDDGGNTATSAPVNIAVATSEPFPIVTVIARDAWAVEPASNSSPNTATFRVRRYGPTNDALVVVYSLSGTAENGIDYDRLPLVATIPAGRRSVLVTVSPLPDDLREGRETIVLRLQEPPPAPGGVVPNTYRVGWPGAAVALISDPPSPPPGPRCVVLPGHLLHVCFAADNGRNFRLEATSDLRNWETLCDTWSSDGAWHFIDTEMDNEAQRFYRLRPEPVVEADE